MGKDRAQVLVWALAALLIIIASTLVMDWFRAAMLGVGMPGMDGIAIALRSIHTITAQIAFWGNILFVGVIAWQCGTRFVTGAATEMLNRLGYGLGALCLINAVFAGF